MERGAALSATFTYARFHKMTSQRTPSDYVSAYDCCEMFLQVRMLGSWLSQSCRQGCSSRVLATLQNDQHLLAESDRIGLHVCVCSKLDVVRCGSNRMRFSAAAKSEKHCRESRGVSMQATRNRFDSHQQSGERVSIWSLFFSSEILLWSKLTTLHASSPD